MANTTGISPISRLELHTVPTRSCNGHPFRSPEFQLGLVKDFSLQSSKGKVPKKTLKKKSICVYAGTNIVESESGERSGASDIVDLELFQSFSSIPLKEFKMSDFELCANVSVGLAGKVWYLYF